VILFSKLLIQQSIIMKKVLICGFRIFIVFVSFLLITTACKKDDPDPLTVTDIDGNTYNTITIGTQIWLKENLKVTKLNDGTVLELVADNTAWGDTDSPAYCWYNNNINTKNNYGGYYNCYTVITGKLCPDGWHVPGDDEWTILTDFLGGNDIAGGKMKETGTLHWQTPNTGATNESGFTAVPGGYRHAYSASGQLGEYAYFWSSTKDEHDDEYFLRDLGFDTEDVGRYGNYYNNGLSVRCIKD